MINAPDYLNLPMVLTPKDISPILGISLDQTYRLFRSKRFPSERVNGKYLIPKPRFLRWLGFETSVGGQAL